MTLHLNGDKTIIEGNISIGGLLRERGIAPSSVAVEHNGHVLERDRYDETALTDGDTVEIVRFMGGG